MAKDEAVFKLREHLLPILAGLVVVAISAGCVWMWRFPELRPYLAALGTFTATIAGPLPALLTPEVRGKWLFAVAVAILIAAGTWLGANGLQDELQTRQERIAQLTDRLNHQATFIGSLIREMPQDAQSSFLINAGRYERRAYRDHDESGEARDTQFWSMLDDARAIINVDPDNGHGLYYAGEAYRHFKDWANMRDMFTKYLNAADDDPDASRGDALTCYDRPHGFCDERTAWIDYLMALDYLRQARDHDGESDVEPARTALQYLRSSLTLSANLKAKEFAADGPFPSSCGALSEIKAELVSLKKNTNEVESVRKSFPVCAQ